LRDVSVADFEKYKSILPETVMSRCRHVVRENARVPEAADALTRGDLAEMGRLMWASHQSLRDDFGVSCRELDLLVEIAKAIPGVLGARLTGGGFGGCTVNLVEEKRCSLFVERVTRQYQAAIDITPDIFAVSPTEESGEMV
jgi:galactokinase